MSEPSEGPSDLPQPTEAEERLIEVRRLLTEATHHLLGDTIAVTDEDWRGPSLLPGWSRGHVASHIAQQADALRRLVAWARTGEREQMYASDEQRDADIEAGAGRTGLDLQIDLDTSAGRLDEAFETLDGSAGWDRIVELRGKQAPARALPLARLGEVVLHHVDLAVGYGMDDLDPVVAGWLLEWSAFRLAGRDGFPALLLQPDSGAATHVGPTGAEPRAVGGSPSQLLGWLTGRSAPDRVEGAEGLVLPPY